MRIPTAVAVAALWVHSLSAQFEQQGPMLIGRGAEGSAYHGTSVAVSADGHTAIAGGPMDAASTGAAWVYVLANDVWRQQGEKLVGGGATGPFRVAGQGKSVALSGDGSTALIGGNGDDDGIGATWVFTRSNGVWTQQGSKLVGTGFVGEPGQGRSVALSSTGDTALIGGPNDAFYSGAAWVFTRSSGVWVQQGSKLTPDEATPGALFGSAVALSADGNTALIGAPHDENGTGAVWVFSRLGGAWMQQGTKLVGAGGVGPYMAQGCAAALSADGSTAMVGGPADANQTGAAWVFTRSSGIWSQQGEKLVGIPTGILGSMQGTSIALSADGNTACLGGPYDSDGLGAVWVFKRSNGVWAQQGSKLVGHNPAPPPSAQGASVALSGDGATAVIGGPDLGGSTGGVWIFSASVPLATGRLGFSQQPTSTEAGQQINPPVTIQYQDSAGNPVNQWAVQVHISLASGSGQLSGTTWQYTDASGKASFPDLAVEQLGTKTITASSVGVTSADSEPFLITAGPPAFVWPSGGVSQAAPIGSRFPVPLEVTVSDQFGNPVSGVTVVFTAPTSGPTAILANGGVAITGATGHASVTADANSVAGGPYLVTASVSPYWAVTFSLTNAQAEAVPLLGNVGLVGLALLLLVGGALGISSRRGIALR